CSAPSAVSTPTTMIRYSFRNSRTPCHGLGLWMSIPCALSRRRVGLRLHRGGAVDVADLQVKAVRRSQVIALERRAMDVTTATGVHPSRDPPLVERRAHRVGVPRRHTEGDMVKHRRTWRRLAVSWPERIAASHDDRAQVP